MGAKENKSVVINDATKRFINAVETVKGKGFQNYKSIAEAIGLSEASMSSIRKMRINAPIEYIETFEKVYKIPIITNIDDNDIQNRLLRIEANLEVFQVAIAGLKAKKNEDFENRFSELQTLIEEAVVRRKLKQQSSFS